MYKRTDTSIENLKVLFEKFNSKYGHYPTTREIDLHIGISAKTLRKKYNGIENLRTVLGLETLNFTKGTHRTDKAIKANNISKKEQDKIYNNLLPIFGKYYIHRESPYGIYSNQRSDFKIFHKDGDFFIDVFYASTYDTFIGCLNIKLKKINTNENIILVNTNKKLDDKKDILISRRKTKLPDNIKVMTEIELLEYCKTLKPIV